MTRTSSEILRIRVAANKLFREWDGINIKMVKSSLYDILCNVDDYSFGVKVGSSTFAQTESYNNYIELLERAYYENAIERIPIVAITVNENTEECKIAFMLGWRSQFIPVINKLPEFRRFSNKSWPIVKNNIKAMCGTIRVLEAETLSVVKRIMIDEPIRNNVNARGEIIYLRRFSNEYRMQEPQITDDKQYFWRLIKGIPQTEYPHDEIDQLIFKAVREQFHSATLHNSLLIVTTEYNDLKTDLDNKTGENVVTLMIEPENPPAFCDKQGVFNVRKIDLKLYYVSNNPNDNYFHNIILRQDVPDKQWPATYNFLAEKSDTIITDLKRFL